MKKQFLILFAFISALALSQVPQRFNKVIVTGDITSPKFIKTGSNSDSVLLGNGSARSVNSLKTDTTSLSNRINTKQEAFVSGTNIRTVNGNSVLGSGDIQIVSGGGGSTVNIYLSNVASSISGYKEARPNIDVAETVKTITATPANTITWGEKYLYTSPVSTTIIPSGFWELHAYGRISTATGISKLVFRVLRYSGSTETILATFTGFEVNNITDAEMLVNGSTNDITVLAGDYLGIQVGFLSDGTSPARTLTYTIGDGHASHFNTPLPTRHSTLRDKNGEVDFQHLTAAQVTKVDNTSGTNTGDETLTSIKTKLGAATAVSDGYLKYQDFADFKNKQKKYIVDITDFGAIGDSVTDNYLAFKNALASSRFIKIPKGVFYVSAPITLLKSTFIEGIGDSSLIRVNGNYPAITVKGSNITIKNIKIIGSNTGTPASYATSMPLQHGIKVQADSTGAKAYTYNNINISSCTFLRLKGAGVYNAYNFNGPKPICTVRISNCFSDNCTWGYKANNQGEYMEIYNSHASNCAYGAWSSSGNNSFVGCFFNVNRVGLRVSKDLIGGNEGHSSFVGGGLNHNISHSCVIDSVSIGYIISSTAIGLSSILVNNSNFIRITSSFINVDSIINVNSSAINITNNDIFSIPIVVDPTNYCYFFNNNWNGGFPANIVNNKINSINVSGTGSFSSTVNSTGFLLNGNNLTSSLTTNYIPKWNGSSFVNSLISDDSNSVTIQGAPSSAASTIFLSSQGSAKQYQLIGQIDGVSNTGFSLKDITNGVNSWYVDVNNNFTIPSTTTSTAPTNGALVVNGGIGANHVRANNFYGNGSNLTGVQLPITLTTNGTSGAATLSGNVLNVPNYGSSVVNQAQTTVNGSTSGNMVCSMPFQTGTYKLIIIYPTVLNGDATYTFPVSFTKTNTDISRVAGTYTAITTTSTNIVISGANNLGGIIRIEGY